MTTDEPVTVEVPEVLRAPASILIGPAGTGKTTLARHLVQAWPGTVLAATTGIAAVNLGEGTTINALVGYFNTESLVEMYTSGYLTAKLGKLWKAGVRRILLDEVSMLDAEQLTCLARALDELAGRRYTANIALVDDIAAAAEADGVTGPREWPIALTLIGDFCQLPPVKAPFAFESPEWSRFADHTHTLSTIWRQTDRAFVTALHAARRGDQATVVEYFGPQLHDRTDPHFAGLTLFGRNEEVDRYNQLRMDTLPGDAYLLGSDREGKPSADWKHIPESLTLKVGALVMILANKREEEEMPPDRDDWTSLGERAPVSTPPPAPTHARPLIYANGDLGTVVEITPRAVRVQLQRLVRAGHTGDDATVEVEYLSRTHTIPLEPGRAAALKAAGDAHRIVQRKLEMVGSISYMPLRVAYASTVHKCQGLTLDSVQVHLRDPFMRTPGMGYVSVSRARTAEGLRLVGTPEGLARVCTVHPKVRGWV